MLIAQGVFHDGQTSAVHIGELLQLETGEVVVKSDSLAQDVLPLAAMEDLRVTSRIANTPRYIYFPGGGKFETDSNDAIDRWLSANQAGLLQGWLHRMESRYRYAALSLFVVIVFAWLSVQYLIPAASTVIVEQLPISLTKKLGEGTLELMDRHIFVESNLSAKKQQQLQRLFQKYFPQQIIDYSLVLHFRHSKSIGANAFALPSGDLLLTDDFVALAQNDNELLAVLAHEVGHIESQHLMRRLVQDSFLIFLITMVTGDVSSVSSIALSAPTVLLEMAYSREFEREADQSALVFLQQHNIASVNFSNIMTRMNDEAMQKAKNSLASPSSSADEVDNVATQLQYYLSTHPATDERIKAFGQPSI
jgi:Zn-dependent protease with chaperone function